MTIGIRLWVRETSWTTRLRALNIGTSGGRASVARAIGRGAAANAARTGPPHPSQRYSPARVPLTGNRSLGFGAPMWLLLATFLSVACSAVYPQVKTPLKSAPSSRELEPPPPREVLYIALEKVEIPKRTRDGRDWDAVGGGFPDPYAIIFIDDEELFRTTVQSNTLRPTWPNSPKRNYPISTKASMRIEIWDDNAIHSQPICVKKLKRLHDRAIDDTLELSCEGGTRLFMSLQTAKARIGLGFYYELRPEAPRITKVLPLSPAERAGLTSGTSIVEVMGRSVKKMSPQEVQSIINMNGPTGLKLRLGNGKKVELREGPIYATLD